MRVVEPAAHAGRPGSPHAPPRPRLPRLPVKVDARLPTPRLSWDRLVLPAILVVASAVRLTNINGTGFNSDEAVYAGQAASLGGNDIYTPYFPVFRAHPMLVQSALSVMFGRGEHDVAARVFVAILGVATVALVYLVGWELYGRRVGALAAAFFAVMPYHVIVTRQLLLDGPMVLFTTLGLYCLIRAAKTDRLVWFVGSGMSLGLAMLAKESAIVMTASVYAFLALTPAIRRPISGTLIGMGTIVAMFAVHPYSVSWAGGNTSTKSYLVWQLVRSPNHELWFYFTQVPPVIGPLVLLACALAVLKVVRQGTKAWREVLLIGWMAVPLTAFTLWPVKGFQYLLPGAPALAVLGAQGVVMGIPWLLRKRPKLIRRAVLATSALVLLSLLIPTGNRVLFPQNIAGMAGTGGTPGGRETGRWIDANTPEGSTFLTLGPSMANIVQYYGHRKAYGISVSPNPLRRNPSYEPIPNPDLALREGDMQYVIWDIFSARRSSHFSEVTLALARRYNGRIIHSEYVDGEPVIVIYEVRP